MKSNDMTRKQFVTLTLTLLGGAAAAAACSSSNSGGTSATGGTNGSGGARATGGSPGAAGSAGGNQASTACADPLPETQLPDSSGHTHSVTIPASDLDATSDQMIDTSVTFGHMHAVTLAVADLAALKAGGQVTVMSSVAGTPPHSHNYSVSCRPA